MVGLLCLVTLTDLQMRRGGLSASAELLVNNNNSNSWYFSNLFVYLYVFVFACLTTSK